MTPKKLGITPEEREWRENLFFAACPEVKDPDRSVVKVECQDRVGYALLVELGRDEGEEEYSPFATTTLEWALLGGGCKQWVEAMLRRFSFGTITQHALDGSTKTFKKADRRAVAVPDNTGYRTPVLTPWWQMSWPVFLAFSDSQTVIDQGRVREKASRDTVLDAYEKHPETRNPEEALALEGIDPRDLHITMSV